MKRRPRRRRLTEISRDRLVCPVCRRLFPERTVVGFCASGHEATDLVRADAHLSVVV